MRRNATTALVFAALAFAPCMAAALEFELSQTKEELKLDYEVTVTDHQTGRVTINLTIADQGRLAWLTSVDLVIPGSDGTGRPDLSIPLAIRNDGGKQIVRAHLLKEWAERTELHLKTRTLDGKPEVLTGYYHRIPVGMRKKSEGVRRP